ncbi:MAG: hypothetical protein AB7U73_02575 [Pirellulales bacterium]
MSTSFRIAPRVWPAKIVLVVAAAALVWIWGRSDIARTDQVINTLKVVAPAVAAIVLWVLILSPWSMATRLALVGAAALAALGCVAIFEVAGLTGDLVPQVRVRPVWRRMLGGGPARPLAASPESASDGAAALEPVDLTTTTPWDSPQFLGPQRRPEIFGVTLARNWQRQPPRELWRRVINDGGDHGAGWSAFAIVGDFAVTHEQRRAKSWTAEKPVFE